MGRKNSIKVAGSFARKMSEHVLPTILENFFTGCHGKLAQELCIKTNEPIGTF